VSSLTHPLGGYFCGSNTCARSRLPASTPLAGPRFPARVVAACRRGRPAGTGGSRSPFSLGIASGYPGSRPWFSGRVLPCRPLSPGGGMPSAPSKSAGSWRRTNPSGGSPPAVRPGPRPTSPIPSTSSRRACNRRGTTGTGSRRWPAQPRRPDRARPPRRGRRCSRCARRS
jgi:hypothetical protein